MHLHIINMCVNSNTDHIHSCTYLCFATSICGIIYYSILYEHVIIIHTVNERIHMLKYSSWILSRVIWRMRVKIHIYLYLIAFIIVIFILILSGTDLYFESVVEAKYLWLHLYVKLFLKCFIIITFCHHRIIVCQKSFSSKILHSCFFSKHNNILWYALIFNIGW